MRDLVQANGGDKSYFWNGYAQSMCCQQQRPDARERRERRLGAPVASVYLVSSVGTSAASCSHWLQMRVYPCGGDKVQWQMAVV